jgi:hypothetical protein
MAALTALVLDAVAVADARLRFPIEHCPLPLLLLCRRLEAAQRAVAANVLCHRGRCCTADGARGMLKLPHFECERVDPPLRLHDDCFGWRWRLRRKRQHGVDCGGARLLVDSRSARERRLRGGRRGGRGVPLLQGRLRRSTVGFVHVCPQSRSHVLCRRIHGLGAERGGQVHVGLSRGRRIRRAWSELQHACAHGGRTHELDRHVWILLKEEHLARAHARTVLVDAVVHHAREAYGRRLEAQPAGGEQCRPSTVGPWQKVRRHARSAHVDSRIAVAERRQRQAAQLSNGDPFAAARAAGHLDLGCREASKERAPMRRIVPEQMHAIHVARSVKSELDPLLIQRSGRVRRPALLMARKVVSAVAQGAESLAIGRRPHATPVDQILRRASAKGVLRARRDTYHWNGAQAGRRLDTSIVHVRHRARDCCTEARLDARLDCPLEPMLDCPMRRPVHSRSRLCVHADGRLGLDEGGDGLLLLAKRKGLSDRALVAAQADVRRGAHQSALERIRRHAGIVLRN